MESINTTPGQNHQQNNYSPEDLSNQDPEKLPQKIKVFRTMSSTELCKFLDREQVRPIVKKNKEDLQGVTTADASAIWFTPDRAEFSSEPIDNDDTLVSDNLKKLNFEDIRKIWDLKRGGINDPVTNNLMVEFLTDKRPKIAYGNYGDYWVKEYIYPEYDQNDFQIQRIYKMSEKEVIFDRMLSRDYASAEKQLREVASRELEEEQWMEQNTYTAMELIAKHATKLPSPY